MKLILKFSFLFIVGLTVAIFVYPFFHEAGHTVSALLFGAEITDFQILPVAFVTLKMNADTSEFSLFIMGLSGSILPFLISLIIPQRYFWMWYIRVTLHFISLISFLLSIISVLAYQTGKPFFYDDVAIILNSFPKGIFLCGFSFLLMSVWSVIMLRYDFITFNKKQLHQRF